jgi:hypothetical protein
VREGVSLWSGLSLASFARLCKDWRLPSKVLGCKKGNLLVDCFRVAVEMLEIEDVFGWLLKC